MPLLDVSDRRRYDHELDLRDRGFVPLVAFDAVTRHLHETLPLCRVRQVVPNKQPHGRIVWSHVARAPDRTSELRSGRRA